MNPLESEFKLKSLQSGIDGLIEMLIRLKQQSLAEENFMDMEFTQGYVLGLTHGIEAIKKLK